MRHIGVVALAQRVRSVRQDECKIDEMSNASERFSKAKPMQSTLDHGISASLWSSDTSLVKVL